MGKTQIKGKKQDTNEICVHLLTLGKYTHKPPAFDINSDLEQRDGKKEKQTAGTTEVTKGK